MVQGVSATAPFRACMPPSLSEKRDPAVASRRSTPTACPRCPTSSRIGAYLERPKKFTVAGPLPSSAMIAVAAVRPKLAFDG